MKILKFRDYLLKELHHDMDTSNLLKPGTVLNLKFSDETGEHIAKCEVSNWAYGITRSPIYYEMKIVESSSKRYPVGSDFFLGFDFNGKVNGFIFHPNSRGGYSEFHYTAKIDII